MVKQASISSLCSVLTSKISYIVLESHLNLQQSRIANHRSCLAASMVSLLNSCTQYICPPVSMAIWLIMFFFRLVYRSYVPPFILQYNNHQVNWLLHEKWLSTPRTLQLTSLSKTDTNRVAGLYNQRAYVKKIEPS